MNKYIEFYCLICIFFSCFLFSNPLISQEKENAILQEAQNNLALFLDKIPNGKEHNYGFLSRAEFNKAMLLDPINVIFPTLEYYSSNSVDTSRTNYYFSKNWEIPISVDNRICCFLRARYIKGNVEVFSIGGNQLAEDLNNVKNVLSSYENMHKVFLVFSDIKKLFMIFYKKNLNYTKSQCISLDEWYISTSENSNLLEILSSSKNISNQKKVNYE